ncbi:hypothetical protein [Methanocella paludicola]|nr:hypothetical protein [Methanocella paludicola]
MCRHVKPVMPGMRRPIMTTSSFAFFAMSTAPMPFVAGIAART